LTPVARASDEADPGWRAARDAAGAGPHLGDPWIAYRVAQGSRPVYLTIDGEESGPGGTSGRGEPLAIGVGFLRRPRFKPWVRGRVVLDLLPVATASGRARAPASTESATAIARASIELAQRAGWEALEIESFDGPSPPPDLAALGCATRPRYEFLLDLSPPMETRFAALKSSHRRKVRDAEKSGVTFADETSAASVELLRELQGHTKERRADRGEEMHVPDAEQYRRLAESFVAGGGARLFVGRKEGRPMSVILCGVSSGAAPSSTGTPAAGALRSGRAYYFMGGTTPEGFECNAATLVLWRASVALADLGVATFNLGGVPREAEQEGHAQHGLFRFKEGFGPTRVDCCSGTWTR
jgi:hypothetical protein